MNKIREAMDSKEMKLLVGLLEMDETYIGGKPRKSNDIKNDKSNNRGEVEELKKNV